MKEELMDLAPKAGFKSLLDTRDLVPIKSSMCYFYYLCELQKWLREKHNLHIDIIHFIDQPVNNELWADCYQFFVSGEAFHPYYKTHEEALEQGLQESLKLIK